MEVAAEIIFIKLINLKIKVKFANGSNRIAVIFYKKLFLKINHFSITVK